MLLHAGHAAAAGHAVDALLHVLLRLDHARARQHQHRVTLLDAGHDLAVVEVGETGADVGRHDLAAPLEEHDIGAAEVGAVVPPVAAEAAAVGAAAARAAHPLEHL